MRGLLTIRTAFLLVAGWSVAATAQSDHALLPTNSLAREIAALQGPSAEMRNEPSFLRARVVKMRNVVGAFVIRQIEAYPAISKADFQKQLEAAFGGKPSGWIGGPRVFAESSGPKATHRFFVIAYGWYGFYGTGGSETILETFVWEKGVPVRWTGGLVPRFFSGFLTKQEAVCWFPNPATYWILVAGQVGGASGRVLGGSAAVFEASANQIMFDLFQVDYSTRTFRRWIHQPLD